MAALLPTVTRRSAQREPTLRRSLDDVNPMVVIR
jgi:hypothetical protein